MTTTYSTINGHIVEISSRPVENNRFQLKDPTSDYSQVWSNVTVVVAGDPAGVAYNLEIGTNSYDYMEFLPSDAHSALARLLGHLESHPEFRALEREAKQRYTFAKVTHMLADDYWSVDTGIGMAMTELYCNSTLPEFVTAIRRLDLPRRVIDVPLNGGASVTVYHDLELALAAAVRNLDIDNLDDDMRFDVRAYCLADSHGGYDADDMLRMVGYTVSAGQGDYTYSDVADATHRLGMEHCANYAEQRQRAEAIMADALL